MFFQYQSSKQKTPVILPKVLVAEYSQTHIHPLCVNLYLCIKKLATYIIEEDRTSVPL